MTVRIQIRCTICRWWAKDLPRMVEIEALAFHRPWGEQEFRRVLSRPGVLGVVAEDHAGRIVGYVVYMMLPTSYEILSLAVHPGRRLQGVGRQLLWRVLKNVKATYDRARVRIEVDERNLSAQRFLRACGVQATGVIPGACGGRDYYRFQYAPKGGDHERGE